MKFRIIRTEITSHIHGKTDRYRVQYFQPDDGEWPGNPMKIGTGLWHDFSPKLFDTLDEADAIVVASQGLKSVVNHIAREYDDDGHPIPRSY